MTDYTDTARESFWAPDEDDAAEFERQREHGSKREREYQQTGYWIEED